MNEYLNSIPEEYKESYYKRYIIKTKNNTYNTDWEYIDQCDLGTIESVIRKALEDDQLNKYQLGNILLYYGRKRQEILYPTQYTQQLREKTIEMNNYLSQKCIQAGKIMIDLLKMCKDRGLDSEKLNLSIDVKVSEEQPWDADEIERATVSHLTDNNLVVKSFYNHDKPEEYSNHNKILGLHSDDDNWNECLPEQWSNGMQLTFPFDRIRDGIPLSWEHMIQIRNYDIIIEETYEV